MKVAIAYPLPVLWGYLGTLILRRLRHPLDAVIGQAKAIRSTSFRHN
jgi:hypothetical protein